MKGSKEMPTFYGNIAPHKETHYMQREQEKPNKASRRRRDSRVDSESDEEIQPSQDSRKNYNRKKKEKQRDMYTKGALGQQNADKRYSSRDGDISELEKYRSPASIKRRHRRNGIEMAIPEDEQIDKFYESRSNSWDQSRTPDSFDIHGARDLQRVRRKARKARVSILNRAEQLIVERKRHEMGSSTDDDEPSHAKQVVLNERKALLKRPFTYIAKERITSPSDDEFVKVKTTVSPLPDIQQDYEILPLNNPRYYSPTKSEIPVLYSDEDYDVFPLPRPLTDTARDRAIYTVYGSEGIRDLRYRAEHVKFGRTKGQLVKFYRNGDQHFKGAELVINRDIRNFETLLSLLTDKIPTPSGVRYIFELPEGRKITSLREFRPGRAYVVSGLKHLNKGVSYGESLEKYWSNQRPSASRVRKNELELFQRKDLSPKESTSGVTPLIVPIINYSHDKKLERILLNPHTTQTFEEWLYDISTGDRPIRCLFTDSQPHTRIQSFSQLFKELKNGGNFIGTAEDYLPVQQYPNKREAPSSNSSSDSISEKSRKKKLLKHNDFELSQIHELNSFESSDSVSLPSSRQFEPEEDPGNQYQNKAPLVMPNEFKKAPPPQPPNNSVQIDIAGRLREFYPPTDRDPYDDGRRPDKMLKIDWVYGYRGKDTRYNLVVLPKTGEMMYFVASVVVLYDKDQGVQRHYTGHNEEITCMTLHPNEYLVATGQMQGKAAENGAHIRIWHGISLSTYSVIGIGAFLGGVISIGFSMQSSGNFMCALDNSNKHILSVWEWQTERIIARTTTSMEPVIYGNFFPEDDTILITFGGQHIYFWKLFYDPAKNKDGRILRDRNSGIFQDYNYLAPGYEDEVAKFVCCIAFTSTADVITGDTNGNLLLWARDESDAFTCKLRRSAHKAPVTALCMLEDGTLLSGSGFEIKAWDSSSNYIEIKTRVIPDVAGDIQKIVPQNYGGTDGKLFIGTSKGCILEGSLQYKFKYLVQSQGEGLTGLVSHPQEPTFVTCGLDQLVIKWSQSKHDVIWKVQVEKPCTCITIEKRTQMLVLGTTEGRFIVLNSYNGMHVASVQSGTQQIECIEFSPDGIHLALGCNDGLISVYSVSEDTQFRKVKSLRGHSCAVQNLDWSSDSLYLQSVDEDLNVCFWDVGNAQQIKQAYVLRDMDWHTHNNTIAYNILGTWTVLENGGQVNTVSRSNFRDLVLTGDDLGRIRLFKYPASRLKAEHVSVKPYSGDMVALTFSFDDTTVISCGGIDTSLIQWNVMDASSG
ncbi:hypothetical protein CHS0354_019890 [Potamilus streckersoni]|uniref:Doublecortin domain-containing protein n=1 Tax=Potamilus streckersoni TaxID=2493646 RepID=A0AAE0SNX1_9BIVA|nr:hypothetical protein CHS0354_019890 [Potamilus streckersoni]